MAARYRFGGSRGARPFRSSTQIFPDRVAREIIRAVREARLEARVTVRIDERRYDGLTPKVDAHSAARDIHAAFRANLGDRAVFHKHRAIRNGLTAIARNESRRFIQHSGG